MKALIDYYWTLMKLSVIVQFQYRVSMYFYMIGMIAEPVIYLVVWSTIARAQGGSVGGYTPGAFAAYYIVWTLVRNMNIVFTPYGWEQRIRSGNLTIDLMRPIHVLHVDIAYFAGWKLVMITFWIPIAAVLVLVFRPELHPTLLQVGVFLIAIWGAYLVRTMFIEFLGLITFWTTRVGAIYELYFALELLLSGRLVPMSLMPAWAQQLAWYLPFQWTFSFPIEALTGSHTPVQLVSGLGMQALWIGLGSLLFGLMWRVSIRRYSAVGN